MGKKLAIQGHLTRGKEIIELLEMMGGNNIHNLSGNDIYAYYIIKGFKNEIRDELYVFDNENIYYFTLEEFLEKFPFKVGDKVFLYDNITEGYVTGMKWDEINGTVKYCVYTSAECWCDVKELLKWNVIDLVEKHYQEQCEEMVKDITLKHLYERGMENINKFPSFEPMFKMNDELEYKIPDGYEITEVSKDKVFIKPIKSKYPKTYEECKGMLGEDVYNGFATFMTLQNLILCRNVYWKIYGEQMGLDKPWEPKFGKYILFNIKFYLYQDSFVLHKGEYSSSDNCILVFPTEEMRDAFYDNFKDLIEQCKELL